MFTSPLYFLFPLNINLIGDQGEKKTPQNLALSVLCVILPV